MCEFTVYLKDEVVARNVVKAVVKEDVLVMMDTKGEKIRIPGASILKLDTLMAELILTQD